MKFRTITYLLLSIGLLSCSKDMIDNPRGNLDEIRESFGGTESVGFRCLDGDGQVWTLTMTAGSNETVELGFQAFSTLPVESSMSLDLREEKSLVKKYSEETGIEYSSIPQYFTNLSEIGRFDIEEGESESGVLSLKITPTTSKYGGKELEPGRYLLPLIFNGDLEHPFYVDITVREKFTGDYDLYEGEEMFFVFYVNTSRYDPRIATDYNLQWNTASGEMLVSAIGNIINLRKSIVSRDGDGNPVLELYPDLKYVLENRDTYILPVQESGRKVCLCIEGGGKGLGFCNLTEAQIESLTDQIVRTLDKYHLQGVNLWDRGTGYGLEGMPEVNTTSYPKFIKRLREKLGHDRLLTLVDFEEPTANFWDKDACGGVEVGNYIDYAWSGYNRNDEPVQVIDPWHQDTGCVSKEYPRKPIAGMEPQRYGCINAYWRSGKMELSIYDPMLKWETEGLRQSNLFVFEDLRSNLQDIYEGQAWNVGEFLMTLMNAEGTGDFRDFQLLPMDNTEPGTNGYGKWLKDW